MSNLFKKNKLTYENIYDIKKRLIERRASNGYIMKWDFDDKSNTVKFYDNQGYEEFFKYDSCGRLISHSDNYGFFREYKYDDNNERLLSRSDSNVSLKDYEF